MDGFLRILLDQVVKFRSYVDHPGYAWHETESGGHVRLTYIASVTHETDPALKSRRLAEYDAAVEAEFSRPRRS